MSIDSGSFTTDLSLRDAIRVESLLGVASEIAAAGQTFRITGSVALMVHMQSKFRVPADLDLVFDSNYFLEATRVYLVRNFELREPPQTIQLFTGECIGYELVILYRDGSGRVLDEISCQLVPRSDKICAYQKIAVSQHELSIETLASLTAAKLDALFKPRRSVLISSRCRDLFDVALLIELGALPPLKDVAVFAKAMLPSPPSVGSVFPQEWLPAWRDLRRSQEMSMSIHQAWTTTLDYANSLWGSEH